jgi:predicted CopG family antitoxin
MGKIRTTITIDEELHKELAEMSDKEERSISQQIAYLVRKGKELADTQEVSK